MKDMKDKNIIMKDMKDKKIIMKDMKYIKHQLL